MSEKVTASKPVHTIYYFGGMVVTYADGTVRDWPGVGGVHTLSSKYIRRTIPKNE